MCMLTRMLCQVCQAKDKYLFQPCGTFMGKAKEKAASRSGTGRQYHCPQLVWTPPEDEMTHHICDGCLRDGVYHFLRTAALRIDAKESAKAITAIRNDHITRCAKPASPTPPESTALVDAVVDRQNLMTMGILESKADPHKPHTIKGFFPLFWPSLPRHFKRFILNNCIPQSKLLDGVRGHNKSQAAYAIKQSLVEGEFAKYWNLRMASRKLRVLTVCIPCCTVCKAPYLNPEGGIKDVEIEPNLPSIDTLILLAECEKSFSVDVQTAFIHKPCQKCIDNETKLRHRVYRYLGKYGNIEAWAVWNWLMMRGSGSVDFWNHEVLNVGFPNTTPLELKKIMDIMAAGWKAKSGTAWEDSIDLGPLGALLGTLQYHDRPLLSLSQWKKWTGEDNQPDSAMRLTISSSQSVRRPAQALSPTRSTSSAGEIRDRMDDIKPGAHEPQKKTAAPMKSALKTRGHPNGFELNAPRREEQIREQHNQSPAPIKLASKKKGISDEIEPAATPNGLRRSSRQRKPSSSPYPAPLKPLRTGTPSKLNNGRLNAPSPHTSGGDSTSDAIVISDPDPSEILDNGATNDAASAASGKSSNKRQANSLSGGAGSVVKRTRFELPGGRITPTDEPVATQSKNDNPTSDSQNDAVETDWYTCDYDFWHLQRDMSPCDRWSLPLGLDEDSSEDEDVVNPS